MFLARFFKFVFRFPFLRKYYFGLYTRVFRPRSWFEGKVATIRYREDLRIRLEIDDWIQQQIYFFGVFDPRGITFLEGVLKPGDVFLDIGANIGCYSLVAAEKVGKGGKVVAFEPVDHVFHNLQFNLDLNGFAQAKAEKLAVHSSERNIAMHVAGRENLGMSSILRHDAENGEIVNVKTTSIDAYLERQGITRVDFVKLDIEGVELEALLGMEKTLSDLRPSLIVEILDTQAPDGKAILEFLKSKGYEAYTLNEKGQVTEFKAYPSEEAYYNYLFLPVEKI